MRQPKKALVVASDAEEAAMLAGVVDAGGDVWLRAATFDEAQALLSTETFDFVLLAVRIAAREGVPIHITASITTLELVREHDSRRSEAGGHLLPILMVSRQEETVAVVSRAHQRGADSFVVVRSEADGVALGDEIRHHLALAGHDARGAARPTPLPPVAALPSPSLPAPVTMPPPPPLLPPEAGAAKAATSLPAPESSPAPSVAPSESIRLRIKVTARRAGKRTVLFFNRREVTLPDALLVALLTVVIGAASPMGPWVDRNAEGVPAEASSRICALVGDALPEGLVLFEPDGFGRVRLSPAAVVDAVPWPALSRHSNMEVRALALAQLDD